jgi:hypothetical protein
MLPQLSRVVLVSAAVLGFAVPARADDVDICRDKQTEAKARLEACEKVMASGQAVAKDLAVALTARGATRHAQQPFTYGSPPGRDDFYFAGK